MNTVTIITDIELNISAAGSKHKKFYKKFKGSGTSQSIKQVVKQTAVSRTEILSRNSLAVGVNLGVNLANSGNLVNVPVGPNAQSSAALQFNGQRISID